MSRKRRIPMRSSAVGIIGTEWLVVMLLSVACQAAVPVRSVTGAAMHRPTSHSGTVLARQIEDMNDICGELCTQVSKHESNAMAYGVSGGVTPHPQGCTVELAISMEWDGAMICGADLSVALTMEARDSLRLWAEDEGLAPEFELIARNPLLDSDAGLDSGGERRLQHPYTLSLRLERVVSSDRPLRIRLRACGLTARGLVDRGATVFLSEGATEGSGSDVKTNERLWGPAGVDLARVDLARARDDRGENKHPEGPSAIRSEQHDLHPDGRSRYFVGESSRPLVEAYAGEARAQSSTRGRWLRHGRTRGLQEECSAPCLTHPTELCFNDPTCDSGGLGCNALSDPLCRFCGFDDFVECPEPGPTPAPFPTPVPTPSPNREQCSASCLTSQYYTCFDDPSCREGGLGCNAYGDFFCRFCGFSNFPDCPDDDETPTPVFTPSPMPSVGATHAPSPTFLTSPPSVKPATFPPSLIPATVAPSGGPATPSSAPAPATPTPSGEPATRIPSSAPAALAPSVEPATRTPSWATETLAPSVESTTRTPASAPETLAPSVEPATHTPSSALETLAPSVEPATRTPSSVPETLAPSLASVTPTTSLAPATLAPSLASVTPTTSLAPATLAPSLGPSTSTPVIGSPTPTSMISPTPSPSLTDETPSPSVIGVTPTPSSALPATLAPVLVEETASPTGITSAPTGPQRSAGPTSSAPTIGPSSVMTPTPSTTGPTAAPTFDFGSPHTPTASPTFFPMSSTMSPTASPTGASETSFVKGSLSATGVSDDLIEELGETALVQEAVCELSGCSDGAESIVVTSVGSTLRALREMLSSTTPRSMRGEEDPSMRRLVGVKRRRLADLTDVEFLIPYSDSDLTASQQAARTFNRMTNETVLSNAAAVFGIDVDELSVGNLTYFVGEEFTIVNEFDIGFTSLDEARAATVASDDVDGDDDDASTWATVIVAIILIGAIVLISCCGWCCLCPYLKRRGGFFGSDASYPQKLKLKSQRSTESEEIEVKNQLLSSRSMAPISSSNLVRTSTSRDAAGGAAVAPSDSRTVGRTQSMESEASGTGTEKFTYTNPMHHEDSGKRDSSPNSYGDDLAQHYEGYDDTRSDMSSELPHSKIHNPMHSSDGKHESPASVMKSSTARVAAMGHTEVEREVIDDSEASPTRPRGMSDWRGENSHLSVPMEEDYEDDENDEDIEQGVRYGVYSRGSYMGGSGGEGYDGGGGWGTGGSGSMSLLSMSAGLSGRSRLTPYGLSPVAETYGGKGEGDMTSGSSASASARSSIRALAIPEEEVQDDLDERESEQEEPEPEPEPQQEQEQEQEPEQQQLMEGERGEEEQEDVEFEDVEFEDAQKSLRSPQGSALAIGLHRDSRTDSGGSSPKSVTRPLQPLIGTPSPLSYATASAETSRSNSFGSPKAAAAAAAAGGGASASAVPAARRGTPSSNVPAGYPRQEKQIDGTAHELEEQELSDQGGLGQAKEMGTQTGGFLREAVRHSGDDTVPPAHQSSPDRTSSDCPSIEADVGSEEGTGDGSGDMSGGGVTEVGAGGENVVEGPHSLSPARSFAIEQLTSGSSGTSLSLDRSSSADSGMDALVGIGRFKPTRSSTHTRIDSDGSGASADAAGGSRSSAAALTMGSTPQSSTIDETSESDSSLAKLLEDSVTPAVAVVPPSPREKLASTSGETKDLFAANSFERKNSLGGASSSSILSSGSRGSTLERGAANLRFSSLGRRARRLSRDGQRQDAAAKAKVACQEYVNPTKPTRTEEKGETHAADDAGTQRAGLNLTVYGSSKRSDSDADTDLEVDVEGDGDANAVFRPGDVRAQEDMSALNIERDGDSSWASDAEDVVASPRMGQRHFDSSPGLGVFAVDIPHFESFPRGEPNVTGIEMDRLMDNSVPLEASEGAAASAGRKLPASALRQSGSFGQVRPRRSVSFADHSDSSDFEPRHDDARSMYTSSLRQHLADPSRPSGPYRRQDSSDSSSSFSEESLSPSFRGGPQSSRASSFGSFSGASMGGGGGSYHVTSAALDFAHGFSHRRNPSSGSSYSTNDGDTIEEEEEEDPMLVALREAAAAASEEGVRDYESEVTNFRQARMG